MKVFILCNSVDHPVYNHIKKWIVSYGTEQNEIKLVSSIDELKKGDLLFLVSCSIKVPIEVTSQYAHSLVIHASDLPKGRGWSPHIWQILEGKNRIVVSLLEAAENIDTGRICKKTYLDISPTALYNEINDKLFNVETGLIEYAIENFEKLKFEKQVSENATYYRKRSPEDSEIDPSKTIKDQFNKIRISDPNRYPAFFYLNGAKYILKIEKEDE